MPTTIVMEIVARMAMSMIVRRAACLRIQSGVSEKSSAGAASAGTGRGDGLRAGTGLAGVSPSSSPAAGSSALTAGRGRVTGFLDLIARADGLGRVTLLTSGAGSPGSMASPSPVIESSSSGGGGGAALGAMSIPCSMSVAFTSTLSGAISNAFLNASTPGASSPSRKWTLPLSTCAWRFCGSVAMTWFNSSTASRSSRG